MRGVGRGTSLSTAARFRTPWNMCGTLYRETGPPVWEGNTQGLLPLFPSALEKRPSGRHDGPKPVPDRLERNSAHPARRIAAERQSRGALPAGVLRLFGGVPANFCRIGRMVNRGLPSRRLAALVISSAISVVRRPRSSG